jgi:hypothetical protein
VTVGHSPKDFNPIAAIVELIFHTGETLSFSEMDQRFVDLMEASGVSEADAVTAFGVWVYYMNHDKEKHNPPRPTPAQEAVLVRVAKQATRSVVRKQ